MDATEDNSKKRKVDSVPPEGYVCRLCSVPGHWIQVCPTKKTGSKKKKSDHVPVPGKDPSQEDIDKARELQKIPPPKCFCGLPSRLNKVKKSKEGGEKSRAIGKYFFFCSKPRGDETQCRFARSVDLEINKQKAREGAIKAAKQRLNDTKPKKEATKPKQICKFFAKKGECKKGKKCEFSHDVQSNKVIKDLNDATIQDEDDNEDESSSSSSSSDDNSNSEGEADKKNSESSSEDDSDIDSS
ncbi:hypothetical protein ACHAXN_009702 [Cyclotella atomus]